MKKRYVNRLRIVAACALAAILLLCSWLIVRSRMRKEDVLPVSQHAVVDVMDGRIITLDNGMLQGFNRHGREKFSAKVTGAESLCIGDGAAAAYGRFDVYLFERSGQISAHIKTDLPVTHVVCGASLVTVITQDEAGGVYVNTYDAFANHLDAFDSSLLMPGDRLMDAGIRGNLLYLLTIDTDGASTLCHAYVFNVQKNTFVCRMDVHEQLIYDVFMDEKNVFLIGTDSILCYNYNGMRLWQMPSADMTCLYGGEYKQNAVLVFSYDETEGGRLLYRTQSFALNGTPQMCDLQRDKLYLLMDGQLAWLDLSDDAHLVHSLQDTPCEDVRILSRTRMLVFDGGQWIARMIP